MSVPRIFDPAGRRLRLARALRAGYARFLVDRVADDIADRAAVVSRRFAHALDLGTPTDAVRAALIAGGRVARVTRAAQVAGDDGDLVADPERLPFAADGFDLVVSALALHGVDDLPGALAQIRRVLRPDGLFLACLLAGDTLTELRRSLLAAEVETGDGAAARIAPFADLRDLGGLLQRAGFALPVADIERVVVRYRDIFGLMRDLRAMGLTAALRARRPLGRTALFRASAIYAERFADPDGRLRATFDLAWLSGWVPHGSQQKPLRPGSATARLADALGTRERPAGDAASPRAPKAADEP